MVYTTDDAQLLGLWTAIRFLGEVREIEDPIARRTLNALNADPVTIDRVRRWIGAAHLRSDQLGLAESRSRPGGGV
jgi:hypothetical protein